MTTDFEQNTGDRAELDWLAFQYVAGELPEELREQFETRLLTDAQAAEAVIRSVALGEAVVLAFEDASGPAASAVGSSADRSAVRPQSGRVVSVLAAVLAIAAALLISFRDDRPVRRNLERHGLVVLADRSDSDAAVGPGAEWDALLLETWTQAGESMTALESDSALDGDAAPDGLIADLPELRPESTGEVPDWLFVAVELAGESAAGSVPSSGLEN